MHVKYSHLLFSIALVSSILIGAALHWEKNQDGVTTSRVCIESDNIPTNPVYGEGASCNVYGEAEFDEGKLRSSLRGAAEGLPVGFTLGFIGLFIGDKLDERFKKEKHESTSA